MIPFKSALFGSSASAGGGGGGGPPVTDGALVSRGATAFSSTSDSAVAWDTEVYDNGGLVNLGTSSTNVVLQTSGLYRAAASIFSGSTNQPFNIFKNGGLFAGAGGGLSATAGNNEVALITSIFSGAASDVLTLNKNGTTTTAPADAGGNWLGVEKLDSATKYALATRASATQSFSGGVTAAMSYTAEVADVGGWFDLASPTLMTVPSGVTRIRLTACILTSSYNGNIAFWISKGDGTQSRGLPVQAESFSGNKVFCLASAVIDVTAGDTFKVNVQTSAAATSLADNRVWFCAEEVPNYARTTLYISASQSIPGAAITQVLLDTALVDTAGAFDSTNHRIQVPSGYTQMRASFSIDAPDGANFYGIVTTGAAGRFAGAPAEEGAGSQSWVSSMGMWTPVSAGQSYELLISNTSNFTLVDSNQTWLCAEFR